MGVTYSTPAGTGEVIVAATSRSREVFAAVTTTGEKTMQDANELLMNSPLPLEGCVQERVVSIATVQESLYAPTRRGPSTCAGSPPAHPSSSLLWGGTAFALPTVVKDTDPDPTALLLDQGEEREEFNDYNWWNGRPLIQTSAGTEFNI